VRYAGQWFDFHAAAIHHESVNSPARAPIVLLAATLLTWHGVLLSMPHHHVDNDVPQEEIACSVSGSSSQVFHLHGSGRLLSPHACLACLAGTTVAEAPGVAEVEGAAVGGSTVATTSSDFRARFRSHLPLLRGPPATS
jgi:hypothetical protein